MRRDFAMPDLGEGLTESELVSWHVTVGELVGLNQPIAEVETAKAIVQLPSPFAGVISQLHVTAGTTVEVGARLVSFDVDLDGDGDVHGDVDADSDHKSTGEHAAESGPDNPERNSVLVGYGPPIETDNAPKRRRSPAESARRRVRTTPPVRKLAADLGIDLASVVPTGDSGTITRADVLAVSAPLPVAGSERVTERPTDSTARPRESRTAIRGVRKATAQAMVQSAFTAPTVTEFLTVDVTASTELLAIIGAKTGTRTTMLTLVAKALLVAIGRTPSINSRWDEADQEIVEFGYVNLGIAVATPRGLLVPNIRDAEDLSLAELSSAVAELATTAREGRTSPEQLQGGTISITNIGVFGIDSGTPILNPGEAAILATGAIRRTPWEYRGEVALRDVMTLSLSFDHRLVDGEQGSRFLADIGEILSNPGLVLTMI
jgi:2-oxoisovalerate dehydrogenase E2 component (dihydrolipoyl transacylase)